MKIETELNADDRQLLAEATDGFVPPVVRDVHGHVLEPSGYSPGTLGSHLEGQLLAPSTYRTAMDLLLPGRRLADAVLFPFPARRHDRPAVNRWMFDQLSAGAAGGATPPTHGLAIVGPADDPGPAAEALAAGRCRGLKPYHFYAPRADTLQVGVEEFAPEWMWKLCDRHGAILMLHVMRDGAVDDPGNREALRRLSGKYPRCQTVLAHIGRSFNHRTARGLAHLVDLPNLWVDTSAIAESESFRCALETFGPRRILYGSDYPISHLRGRCVTVGGQFLWLYPETAGAGRMTLVGIESLLALREACTGLRLGADDIRAIFHDNTGRLLDQFHARS